jgi:hypothetical protein
MSGNMALKNGSSGTVKLVGILLTPSWSSSIFTILGSSLVVGGTILLTRLGSATQQSILGLHMVYKDSQLGVSTNAVGQHITSNTIFNNGILFVLWGSVGLVVYSIVQGFANELRNTDELLHELTFVHVDRHTIVRDLILRAITRFAALAGWWILAWVMLHKVFPYAIAAAHDTAYSLRSAHDWLHTLIGFGLCLLTIHGLIVLLRLIVLRPRLTGNSILDN